jgi:hypothetical protein
VLQQLHWLQFRWTFVAPVSSRATLESVAHVAAVMEPQLMPHFGSFQQRSVNLSTEIIIILPAQLYITS